MPPRRAADPLNERLPRQSFAADARRLVPLAWPVLVGQVAVLGDQPAGGQAPEAKAGGDKSKSSPGAKK